MTSTQRRRLDLWLQLGDLDQVAAAEGVQRSTVRASLRRVPRDELAAEGFTVSQIARLQGVSHQAVSQWLRHHGVSVAAEGEHRPGWQDERRRLLEAGCSVAEVAEAQGVTEAAVRRWARRHGVAMPRTR